MEARLILEDGTVFKGTSFGAQGDVIGEACFFTGVVGYEDIITDPGMKDKICVMTYPLIGNYGMNEEDMLASSAHLSGLVIYELSKVYSSWTAKSSLESFMKDSGVVGIADIDTRALTVHIRNNGEMRGIITTSSELQTELMDRIRAYKPKRDHVYQITRKNIERIQAEKEKYDIAVLDLGIDDNTIKELKYAGAKITIYPAQTLSEVILEGEHNGIIIPGGPGEPKDIPDIVKQISNILGKVPLYGIDLGHLILGELLGARVELMEKGHRGLNHAVEYKDRPNGLYMTTQNHIAILASHSLNDNIEVTATNLVDNTIEAIKAKKHPAFSVQYRPFGAERGSISREMKEFLSLIDKEEGGSG